MISPQLIESILYLMFFLFAFSIIIKLAISQKAFIFSSSVGYYNYRQNANTLKVYQILKNNGFEDKDITLAFPQNVGCCEKNPRQGSVSFYDNQYQNINKNLEVDLKFNMISASSILDSLRLKYSPSTLNINRLSNHQQPYFIYLSGHGGDNYFKIRQRQAIVAQHFSQIFQDLAVRHPQSFVFLMIDSCSAITPFQNVDADNFVALGSSSVGQKSLSYGYDPELNQPKSDEFTYYFGEFLKEKASSHDQSSTIKDLLTYLDFTKLKVHAKISTKLKKNSRRSLKEFLNKEMKINERKMLLKLPSELQTNNNE